MPDPKNSSAEAGGRPTGPDAAALRGYEVIVCVTGGIAAYKTAALVSALVQDGCGVTVAMTRNARRFVGCDTFAALSGRPVLTRLWTSPDGEYAFPHLDPCQRADLIVVAPATANIIGKLAGGIADDLVSTLLLGADTPVLLAPAMNTRMWQHPAVQRNIAFLRDNGFLLVEPETGWLACREVGAGRMPDAGVLHQRVREQLQSKNPRNAK